MVAIKFHCTYKSIQFLKKQENDDRFFSELFFKDLNLL